MPIMISKRKTPIASLPLALLMALSFSANADHGQDPTHAEPKVFANGMLGTANLNTSDSLSIDIELEAGPSVGINADWWLVADAGDIYFSYDAATALWVEGIIVAAQAPLADLELTAILDLPAPLPAGNFTFYFAVDLLANGEVDLNYLVYSAVTVNVSESTNTEFSMISPYFDANDMLSVGAFFEETHRGLDFATNAELRPFRAAAAGTVDKVELVQLVGTGNWQVEVDIKLDETYTMFYAFEPLTASQADGQTQLDNITVQPGQSVAQGDEIGLLFTAGAPDMGAHVHFGLFRFVPNGGDPTICPEPYFTNATNLEILDLIQQDEPQLQICN